MMHGTFRDMSGKSETSRSAGPFSPNTIEHSLKRDLALELEIAIGPELGQNLLPAQTCAGWVDIGSLQGIS
jgi:hypothetical protein